MPPFLVEPGGTRSPAGQTGPGLQHDTVHTNLLKAHRVPGRLEVPTRLISHPPEELNYLNSHSSHM